MKKLAFKLLAAFTALGFAVVASAAELLNLTTSEAGMHRITYEQMVEQSADLAGLPHRRFALTLNGEPVQLRTKGRATGRRGQFGPGGFIEFYAEKANSLYSNEQVFTLHLVSNRELDLIKRIRNVRTSYDKTQQAAVQYQHTELVEQNNTYDFAAPSPTDPFHFGQTFSLFATPTYEFTLENVVGGSANAQIKVEMYGLLDFDIEGNDHHFEVLVNDQLQGDQQFDGATATQLILEDVPVNSGVNTFKYNYRPIAGVPFDRITLNKFSVKYLRTTEANEAGYLEGYFDSEQARVSNVGPRKASVYRRSADGTIERIIRGVTLDGADTVFNTNGVAADYIVVADSDELSGYKSLGVKAIPEYEDISSGTAEYVVIAHPSLMGEELDELVELRSQRYLTRIVDVNQIYAQYGNHIVGPDAIQAYVDHASDNMGAKMFLLVGSDTLDYKQHISQSISLIPTKYVTTPGGALIITQTPSDASYGDRDRDGVPDKPFGRISARTKVELGNVVAKIKAYEARVGYIGRTVIATDKADLGNNVNFVDDAQAMIDAIPSSWSDGLRPEFRAYPDVDGHQLAHDKLINLINLGVSVVSYVGHSSQQSWAYTSPPMLRANEISQLTNVGKPTVVTQWGCWNTYFVDVNGNTMADEFLLTADVGAATVLGASTLTSSTGERALGIELNRRIYTEGITIGEAMIQAKQALAEYADYPAVQLGWQMLGDPALVIDPL